MKEEILIALCDSIISEKLDSIELHRGPRGLRGKAGDSFNFDEHEEKIFKIIKSSIEKNIDNLKLDNIPESDIEKLKLRFSNLSEDDKAELKGSRGQKGKAGDSFIFEDEKDSISLIIENYISSIKNELKGFDGEIGPRGQKGSRGDSFSFEENKEEIAELVKENVIADKGEQGVPGERGPRGQKGSRGDSFCFEENKEEVAELVKENVVAEKGEQGSIGEVGPRGPKGSRGDSFCFEENKEYITGLVKENIVAEKGEQGVSGERGPRGQKGSRGDSFNFEENKEAITGLVKENVIADKGEQGVPGERGPRGQKGSRGDSFDFEEHKDDIDNTVLDYFKLIKEELKLNFSDLTVEQVDGLKLKYDNLTDENKEELKGDRGARGQKGSRGKNGLSALEIWQEINNGESKDFLRSLVGPRGIDGIGGVNGTPGKDGIGGRDGTSGKDGSDAPHVVDVELKKGRDSYFKMIITYSDGVVIKSNEIKLPKSTVIQQFMGGSHGHVKINATTVTYLPNKRIDTVSEFVDKDKLRKYYLSELHYTGSGDLDYTDKHTIAEDSITIVATYRTTIQYDGTQVIGTIVEKIL